MPLTARRISLEAHMSQRSRSACDSVPIVTRTLSSNARTVTKGTSACPQALFLPPINASLQARKHSKAQHPIRPPKNNQKASLDEQILTQRSHQPRSISKQHHGSGLTQEALTQRRENNLNTYYNLRKNRLVEITKANRRIYERINSQTSLYSSKELNRSYQSNRSLSRRLSLSRASKLSSLSSNSIKHSSKEEKQAKKPPVQSRPMKIETKDITKMEANKMYRYLSIFCNHLNINQPQPSTSIKRQPIISFKLHKGDKENMENVHRNRLSKIEQQGVRPIRRGSKLQCGRRV